MKTNAAIVGIMQRETLVLIVTEPTVTGVHDVQRVLDLIHHLGIPVRMVINRAIKDRKGVV